MKRVLPVLAVLGAVAAWPAASGAATFKGVVVAKEGGRLLVASPSGVVNAVAGRAVLGARVLVTGGKATVVGRSRTALIHGVVVRNVGQIMYVSSNHHVVAIRAAKTRRLSSASDTTPVPGPPTTAPSTGTGPAPGAVVDATATVSANGLDEDDVNEVGQQGSVQIQATITKVGPGNVTVLVNGKEVTFDTGAITLGADVIGKTVTLTLDLSNEDGSQSGGDGADGDNGDNGGGSGD